MIGPLGLQIAGALQRVPAALEFERAARDPARAQEVLLRRILDANRDAEFSKKHGLGDVKTRAELRARMPITTYDDVRPWIERQMRGEHNVLTTEDPVFFAASTGTTGTPKRIPMTPTYRADFQRTLHVSMTHVLRRFPAAFTGNIAYSVGVARIDTAPCGTPIGFTSGYNQSTLPAAVRKLFAWPHELAQVKDGPTRTYLAAWLTALARVTLFTGVFPLPLLALYRAMEELAEPLVRDLRAGSLRDDLALTAEERALYARFARADRRAADRIEAMTREAGGRMPLRAVLPDLRLVYCWTTGSASAFVPDLKKKLGDSIALRDAIYASNEGWGNVTFGEEEPGGPVALTSHVFEYVEEGAWERGDRVGVGAEDLEVGKLYRLLVTTSGGLCRYDTGDLLACTRRYHATPCVHFARRAGAAFNIVGEKLVENHVVAAVGSALAALGRRAASFVALPRYQPGPHWAIALELGEGERADAASLGTLRERIEAELRSVNEDYAYYRTRTLGPLALHVIAPGDSEARRRALLAAGKPEAQLKTVHLVTDDAQLATLPIIQTSEASA